MTVVLGEDTNDEVRLRAQREKARKEVQLKLLLDIYEFREFIWDLLGDSGYFDASFTGDAPTTFYREGKRAVGQQVFIQVLTARTDAYTVMRDEAIGRAAALATRPGEDND